MNTDPSSLPPAVLDEYQQAYARVGRGEFAEAVSLLQRCVAAAPSFVEARKELAHALTKLGRGEEALKQRLAVVDLEPHNLKYRIALINQLSEAKRYTEALPLAEALLAHEPDLVEYRSLARKLRRLAEVGCIFVSYRSHDSDAARATVELLLANDFDVWFAEYRVLSLNYEHFTQELESALQRALAGCETALVFTNDRWAESAYCQQEIRFISKHYPKDRILQVCVPTKHSRPLEEWPILREVATRVCDFRSRDEVAALGEWLLEELGVVAGDRRLPELAGRPGTRETLEDPYRGGNVGSLWPGAFVRTKVPWWMLLSNFADIQGMLEGSPQATFRHPDCHGLSLVVDVRPTRWTHGPLAECDDDRAIYRHLRSVVRRGFESHAGSEERGLHLLHWSGQGHLAFTFCTPAMMGHLFWKRIYVLRVRNLIDGSAGEVNLTFSMCFEGSRPGSGDLRRFVSVLPQCDEIARSLNYEGYASRAPLARVRLAWALAGTVMALLAVWLVTFWGDGPTPATWGAAALAGGVFGLVVNHLAMVQGHLRRSGDAHSEN